MTAFDLLAVGEAMVLLAPDPPERLRAASRLRVEVAGAESNVACHLARLGRRSAFAGRVGSDPFGDVITERLSAAGVTCLLPPDRTRRTGIYFKDPSPQGTRVHYYRDGSAASAMDAALWDDLPPAGIVHLTGITPALSAGCTALVERVLAENTSTTTFDVNYRPALWPVQRAAPVLLELADQADVVFVGLDEAQHLWGAKTAEDVRELLPKAGTVVVKDGANEAVALTADRTVAVATPRVEVLEPVGAGDAFAAGYLFGVLTDVSEELRLSLGHQVAGAVLRSAGDLGELPQPSDLLTAATMYWESMQ